MQAGQNTRRVGGGWLQDYCAPVPGPVTCAARPLPAGGARPRWSPRRMAAVAALWGDGFTGPGGPQETLRLAAPMGLNSNASLLVLGGGMGGPAETIVDTFGSWVASFEADAELAQIAEQRRARHPAGKRMQVAGWDRENPSFGHHNAHHALALEGARGAPLDRMLEAVAAALRPRGHVMITEMVADTVAPGDDREFAAWCRLENRAPSLPRLDQVTSTLARLHFDVRVVEDVSDRHVSETLAGWRAAVKSMARGPKPDIAAAAAFVTEAELWLLRIRMMRRFGFRLVRWHAVGAA